MPIADIHRGAIVRILDTVRREAEHGDFAIEHPGCDEERFAAAHGVHVYSRNESALHAPTASEG